MLLLLVVGLVLSGCSARTGATPVADQHAVSLATGESIKASNVSDQKKIITNLEGDLAAAKANLVVLQNEARATKLYWVGGVLGFVALIAGVGSFLPVLALLATNLRIVAAACGAAAAVALFLGDHVAWLPYIGALVLLGAVTYVLWGPGGIRTWLQAHLAAIASWVKTSNLLHAIAAPGAVAADRMSLAIQTPAVQAVNTPMIAAAQQNERTAAVAYATTVTGAAGNPPNSLASR
jgi:hypothetical protein